MYKILLIGIGGAVGSIARYILSGSIQQLSHNIEFPYGTLFVNLLGCFIIGLCSQLADVRGFFTPEARALIFVGLLGGFTTFSTFSNESVNLLMDGETVSGFANIATHVIAGLAMVWIGRITAEVIWR